MSKTVTLSLHVLDAPPVLNAVHVTVVRPSPNTLPDAGLQDTDVMASDPPAVGVNVATAVALAPFDVDTFMLAGHVIVGGIAFVIDIVKLHVETLLALSVAVHITYLVPTGNVAPDVALQFNDLIPEASDAMNANDTTVPAGVAGSAVIEAGHVIVGGARSCTAKLNLHVDTFSALSVAVHVTGVWLTPAESVAVPVSEKLLPDAGEHTTLLMPESSLTVGANVTACVVEPDEVSTVRYRLFMLIVPGHVMIGGAASFTVTLNLHVALLPP